MDQTRAEAPPLQSRRGSFGCSNLFNRTPPMSAEHHAYAEERHRHFSPISCETARQRCFEPLTAALPFSRTLHDSPRDGVAGRIVPW
jgi:hypothetical protein